MAATGKGRCIACRTVKDKTCFEQYCFWAPYFPYGQREGDFTSMHKRFDCVKVRQVLHTLPTEELRRQAVKSFVWEAKAWEANASNPPHKQYLSAVEKVKALEMIVEGLSSDNSVPNPENAGIAAENVETSVENAGTSSAFPYPDLWPDEDGGATQ